MDKKFFKEITLIIPTFNCSRTLKKHLKHLNPFLDRFGQIIAVDSYSTDGSFELLEDYLSPHNALIYQRERGLYESWNDAISNALYSYCYISTIGDLPDLERLEAFFEKAILSNADISISPPRVIKEDTPEVLYNHWPIHKIISEFSIDTPIFLETELLSEINAYCVVSDFFASLSGSFASNLSKTKFLQNNPFPTNFQGVGDVLWWARISQKSTALIYPRAVCTFLLHEKTYNALDADKSKDFLNEISKTLKLEREFKNTFIKYAHKVIKNNDLRQRYKLLRIFMPQRYTNKFNRKKLFKKIKNESENLRLNIGKKITYTYSFKFMAKDL